MKPLLSYGFAVMAMFALVFLIKNLVGIELAMIIGAVITFWGINKAFPIRQEKE